MDQSRPIAKAIESTSRPNFRRTPLVQRWLRNSERISKFSSLSERFSRRLTRTIATLSFVALWAFPLAPVEAQPKSEQASNETKRIHGSRLLTPSSLGIKLPTAQIEPLDLSVVLTKDEFGNNVKAKAHVKVGDNYVVKLPNGQLVGRRAAEVRASDSRFKAASHRAIAREIMVNRLSDFSGMQYEKSANYVYLFNTSDRFQQVTKGILESMLKGVKKYCEGAGLETHSPEQPLVVIMFRTERQFQAFRPMPEGVVAYYDMVSNYVVLREESPLGDVRPDLAQSQLLSTIAHEGAHQILHNIGIQQRLSMWPMWLNEGLAEYMAPTSIGKRNRWKGAGDVNDLRMFEVETLLQERYVQNFDGRILEDIVTTQKLDSTGYATAWSLVHYLAKKDKKQFHKYLSQLQHIGPLTGMVARPDEPVTANLDHFKIFFGENLESEEKKMVEYLTKLDYESPFQDYIHYVGLATIPQDGARPKRMACFFHTEDRVDDWKQLLIESLSPEQRSSMSFKVERVKTRDAATKLMGKFRKGR